MDVAGSLKQFGLVPSDDALPRIRTLLAQEVEAERNGGDREDDLALLCCVQLFSRGLPEDILRIWDAKQSGMDLGSCLDIQFLCGAGLDTTKRFLASRADPASAAALDYLLQCEQAGDFQDYSPHAHLETYRQYFAFD